MQEEQLNVGTTCYKLKGCLHIRKHLRLYIPTSKSNAGKWHGIGAIAEKNPNIDCNHQRPEVISGMYQITTGLLESELKYDYNNHLNLI